MTPGGIELAPGVYCPPSALRFQFARSSGPGGQNVNKLNTKAELWLDVDSLAGLSDRARARLITIAGRRLTTHLEIHIASDSTRSQESNRAEVLSILRAMIVQALKEPKKRKRTKPSKASKQRRLDSKHLRSKIKTNRRTIDRD
jgi:ribosome-associated protein